MTSSQTSCSFIRKPPEGLFARLLDSVSDIYALVLDQDGLITYANVSFLDHFGLGLGRHLRPHLPRPGSALFGH